MKQAWKRCKPWQRFAVFVVGLLIVRMVLNGLWGSAGADEGATVSVGGLVPLLLILLGGLVLMMLLVVMLATTVGGTVRRIELQANPHFQMPHRSESPGLLPASMSSASPAQIVDQLEALGFQRAGSYDVEMPDHTAVFACLLSAEGTTMAIVTPVHLTMESNFGGKLLVTADRNTGATHAPWVLQQISSTKAPEIVWETHRMALDRLRERGHVPDRFGFETASATAVDIDRASIEAYSTREQFTSMLKRSVTGGPRPLVASDDPRITQWVNVTRRWTDTPHS